MNSLKFKVGDVVRIAKDSEYYGRKQKTNPSNMDGKVVSVKDTECYSYGVDWDNGEYNNYREHDLVYADSSRETKNNELTVSADFVKAAHSAACLDWKKKIESQFPELFPNENFQLTEDGKTPTRNTLYYYCNGEYVPLKGVELAAGITEHGNNYGLDRSAEYRALWINRAITDNGYEVKTVPRSDSSAVAITFTKKK